MLVTISDIDSAAVKLKNIVMKTPLQYSKRLSNTYAAEIYLKREDLQEVRSFKIRGAFNKMASLSPEESKRGVVCASAGNHAQGVAYSCSALKIKGAIFMPTITPNQKIEKVKHFGGDFVEIILTGFTFDESYISSQEYCKKKNSIYVHPFDDPYTIAGQGTVGKEIYEQADGDMDIVVSCIGGGGLISGISSYIKQKNPSIVVYGSEPKGAAGMYASLNAGHVVTLEKIDPFVDGAAVKTVGRNTFEICNEYLEKIIVVPEGKVCQEMVDLYQNEGIIAEPAGTLAIAALDELRKEIKGKKVICILSGGNNDILRYPEVMERSLVYQGLKHYFILEFAQKPGQLKKFVNDCLGPNDDIVRFEYIKQTNKEKGPALVGIELKKSSDLELLLKRMGEIGLNSRELKENEMIYDYLV